MHIDCVISCLLCKTMTIHISAMKHIDIISDYHAHVYFAPEETEKAQALCETASREFGILMGRMHPRAIGPHATGSCQLSVPAQRFGEIIPWLALNRQGLSVLVHPSTGDHLADHTDHVIWLGQPIDLRLELFR